MQVVTLMTLNSIRIGHICEKLQILFRFPYSRLSQNYSLSSGCSIISPEQNRSPRPYKIKNR